MLIFAIHINIPITQSYFLHAKYTDNHPAVYDNIYIPFREVQAWRTVVLVTKTAMRITVCVSENVIPYTW